MNPYKEMTAVKCYKVSSREIVAAIIIILINL
jgi:hypothetical protein